MPNKGLVVLLDPTDGRETLILALTNAGYIVLPTNTNYAEELEAVIQKITPDPDEPEALILKPFAVVMEAYHPLSTKGRMSARDLVNFLDFRGLKEVTYLLYTSETVPLGLAKDDIDFAAKSGRSKIAKFQIALERTQDYNNLIEALAALTPSS
jgi:hypothetical protein